LLGEHSDATAINHFQGFSAATSYAGERIFRNNHRQAGLFADELVQAAQQRTATGQYNAALGDIRGQFWRRLLQGALHGLDDLGQGFLKRVENFFAVQGEGPGYTFSQVAAANVDFAHFQAFIGTADFMFDTLGRGVADQAAVVATDVGDEGFVEFVATYPHGVSIDDAIQGDDGDFGGAATDVDDHGAAGFFYRQAGTDGRRHGL